MSKILVIRLSAIGDVAMTIPVLYAAAVANPQDSFTVLTQNFLIPLFINHPPNINFMGINTQTAEKPFVGFLRYAWTLRKYKFDKVLDLHAVIRSYLLGFVLSPFGGKIVRIDKGRKAKEQLTARPPKEIRPLQPVTARYADVFRKAGLRFEESFVSLYSDRPVDQRVIDILVGEKTRNRIGIAPFARHKGKIYPLGRMEEVLKALSEQGDAMIYLFGGRGEEEEILNRWERRYEHTNSVAGFYSLDMELALISQLDVLVCMDSANMHLASLTGTKVISIWGATHPYAGFYGYRQPEELAIQLDLSCRPCSIYGDKPCYRGDWACMEKIRPKQILEKINDYLKER